MNDGKKKIPQRRRGAKGGFTLWRGDAKEERGFRLRNPMSLWVMLGIVVCTANLQCNRSAQVSAVNGRDIAAVRVPPTVRDGGSEWPLGRGNALADGVAKTTLPEKPEVAWKVEIDKGAFEGTPVIANGVVYLGDMDGKVYAWSLADGKEVWTYKVESGFIASPAIRGGLL